MTNPKITLDTNCLINLFDRTSKTRTSIETLGELIKLALSGKLDIAVTTRVEADLEKDSDIERQRMMREFLGMVPVVGSAVRLDVSRWDSGDTLISDKQSAVEVEIRRILFPGLDPSDKRFSNKINDIDHVLGHWINKRDYFVTDDGGILAKQEALQRALEIQVMTPADCLAMVAKQEEGSEDAAFPAKLEHQWRATSIKAMRHEYELNIAVHNTGRSVLRNYYVELHIPKRVLLSLGGLVLNRKPGDDAVIRVVCDRPEDILYPGDVRTVLERQYFMDNDLFWSDRGPLSQAVRIVLTLENGRSTETNLPFKQFQKF